MLTSLIQETQIKTIMRSLTPIRMDTIKKEEITNVGEDERNQNLYELLVGM